MVVILNWIDIDKNIISMMGIYTDKELLFKDVKKLYNWNDSQVEHAVEPLLKRWGWYDKKVVEPVKKKRATKKAPAKKAKASTTKKKKS